MTLVTLPIYEEERSPLVAAVLAGDIPGTIRLLDLHYAYHEGSSLSEEFHLAFWYACVNTNCQPEIVENMLRRGADVNTKTSHDQRGVMLPAFGHIFRKPREGTAIARLLLEHGADPNPGRNLNGQTPLTILTCTTGDVELMELLLRRGARVDDTFLPRKSCPGMTPLWRAVTFNYGSKAMGMTKILLEYGANVNEKCDKLWETPLHQASKWGCKEVVELLIDAGADVNAMTNTQNVRQEDQGMTPLMFAIPCNRNIEVMKVLLESGATVNVKDGHGHGPIYHACRHGSLNDITAKVRLLLDFGADVNARDNYGSSPLTTADCSPHAGELVPLLLENGANPNFPGSLNSTPLHYVADCGYCSDEVKSQRLRALRALLAAGADTRFRRSGGSTPLHSACRTGNMDGIFLLLQAMKGDGTLTFLS